MERVTVPRMLVLAALTIGLLAGGCGGSDADGGESDETSQAAAGGEVSGEVLVYSTIGEEYFDPVATAFAEQYPDVDVSMVSLRPAELLTRVSAEQQAGSDTADMILQAVGPESVQLANDGAFAPYESPELSAVPERFAAPDNSYVVPFTYLHILARNTDETTDGLDSWQAMTDPALEGKVAMSDPRAGGGNFLFIYDAWKLFGCGFFDELAANDVTVVGGGHGDVLNRVVSGQSALGVALTYQVRDAMEDGAPIEPIFPTEGSGDLPYWMAILEPSAGDRATETFYDFVLSEEGQTVLRDASGYYAVREGVEPPSGLPALDDVEVIPQDLNDFATKDDEILGCAAESLDLTGPVPE